MPTFTFTKAHDYGNEMGDPSVSMTFTTDNLETLRINFEDFLRGAGFVIEEEEVKFERKLEVVDKVQKEEDWMWNDAFKAKFANHGKDMDSFTVLGDK